MSDIEIAAVAIAAAIVYLIGAGALWRAVLIARIAPSEPVEMIAAVFWPVALCCWLGSLLARRVMGEERR